MLRPLSVQEQLLAKKMVFFTPVDFARLFHMPCQKTKYFLETYTKQGLFIRLKQGLYALKNALPSEEAIANVLYRPSYLSFEYALAHYGIIPEMVYQVTSATTKSTRSFSVEGKDFSYLKIKKEAFTGYTPVKHKDVTVLFAEPEKATVDYLYFVSLGKKSLNERMRWSNLNREKIKQYASLYKRPPLMNILKKLYL